MSKNQILALVLVTAMLLVTLSTLTGTSLPISDDTHPPSSFAAAHGQSLGNVNTSVPRFTENLGQWPSEYRFMAETDFGNVWFTNNGLEYVLGPIDGAFYKVNVNFQNGTSSAVGQHRMPLMTSFLIGNESKWRMGVSSYGQIEYRDVWPGVDLIYRFEGTALKYDVKMAANSRLNAISFEVFGAAVTEVGSDLVLDLGNGICVSDGHLSASYDDDGSVIPVSFSLHGPAYGFDCAEFDAGRSITIDPLVYSTFIGGSGKDQATGLVLDTQGNVYVTGTTRSSAFPTTDGAFQGSTVIGVNDPSNAFVAKLDPTGTQLLYSTVIGGSGSDQATGIAVDGEGRAYVTGFTGSSDFPTTTGGYQRTYRGATDFDDDVFVLKLDPIGSGLVYSTYVGGTSYEQASGITTGLDGSAYVTGFTGSSDFPTSTAAYQTAYGGGDPQGGGDSFVFKLNPSGTGLTYCTYLGGDNNDLAAAIEIDGRGNAYITGYSDSTTFPTTSAAYQTLNKGIGDVFVVELDQTGSHLIYSTLVGGSTDDYSTGMAVDDQGNVYVAGYTLSSDFPISGGSFQTAFAGVFDAFVFKMDATGNSLIYSTFVGGSGYDNAYAITVDTNGTAYLTGSSNSDDFPTSNGAYQTTRQGTTDAFVLRLDPNGGRLLNSTLLGGHGWSEGDAIALGRSGQVYLAGLTSAADFPVPANGSTRAGGGSDDAFVLELTMPDALPGAPKGLAWTPGESRVTLSWQAPPLTGPAIESYAVYQEGSKVIDLTVRTSVINDLVKGQPYRFYVRAYNAAGLGAASDIITAYASNETVPQAPTHLTAVGGERQVSLRWDPPKDNGSSPLTGYFVYYGESSPQSRYEGLVPVGTESVLISDLNASTPYQFAVSAVNGAGEGNLSDPITMTAETPKVAVSGRITDHSGNPLSDIKVQLDDATFAITDAGGHFSLQAVPGNHTLKISGNGVGTGVMNEIVPPSGVDLGTLEMNRTGETDHWSILLIMMAAMATSVIGTTIFIVRKMRRNLNG